MSPSFHSFPSFPSFHSGALLFTGGAIFFGANLRTNDLHLDPNGPNGGIEGPLSILGNGINLYGLAWLFYATTSFVVPLRLVGL